MEKKICFVCDQHVNPFKGYWGYNAKEDNPENFVKVQWFGTPNTDDTHKECWQNKNK